MKPFAPNNVGAGLPATFARWRPWAALLACALGLAVAPVHAGLLLSEALHLAADRDPAYAAAKAAREAQVEAGVQERSTLKPQVSLSGRGDYVYSDSTFPFGTEKDKYPAWSATLEARQPLLRFDWGARLDRAKAQDALAETEFHSRQIDFIARVCRRFLDAMLAQDQLRQSEAEATAIREALDDTQKRYDVELVPGTDLKEARARNDLTQAQLIAARARVEETRDSLQEITGYDRADLAPLKEKFDLPEAPAADLEGWLRLAEDRNAILLSARLRAAIAKADAESRRSEVLPELDVVASAGRNDSLEYALGSRQDEARIGVELNMPIYGGGLLRSRVREADARREEAEFNLKQVRLDTEREIRKAYRDIEAALAADTAYSRVLESAQAAEAAVRAGYDAGTRTISDVLDAKSRVVQARRDRNEVRYDLLTRALIINSVAGTLTVPQISAMDRVFDQPQ